MPPEPGAQPNLGDHLRVLRSRKWSIGLFTLLVVAASVGASALQTPVYRASADLLLKAHNAELLIDPAIGGAVTALEPPTEVRVLESEPVRRLVEERIGDAPAVSVTNPAETDFLVVTAESPDPESAAVVANTYAQAYVDFRRQQAVDDIEAAVSLLEAKVQDLDSQISAAPQAPPGETNPATVSLERDRALFASRVDQLTLAVTQQTGGVELVSPATAPTAPVRPTLIRNGVLALFVGLVLAMGLAFLREHLDDSLKTKDDVERMVPGAPVLGLIPALTGWKDRKAAVVVSLTDPSSPAAEAYRSLRTSVQFLGIERSLRTVQVTSPSAAEGKSTTIANLAVAVAGAGRQVFVVDADLRRPRLHEFFDLQNDVGLTSVLIGHATLVEALQRVDDVPGLFVLASGPVPPNPSELLAGARFAEQLRELAQHCDFVLVDCPPVLPVTDATVLASRVDGTLLVVKPGETDRRKLGRAAEMLGQVNAQLLGVVLNSLDGESSYSYSYRYAYSAAPRRPPEDEALERPPPSGAGANGGNARPVADSQAVGVHISASDPLGGSPHEPEAAASPPAAPKGRASRRWLLHRSRHSPPSAPPAG